MFNDASNTMWSVLEMPDEAQSYKLFTKLRAVLEARNLVTVPRMDIEFSHMNVAFSSTAELQGWLDMLENSAKAFLIDQVSMLLPEDQADEIVAQVWK